MERRVASTVDLDDLLASPIEGQHEHTVDDKGRLSIPSEFRTALDLNEGDELVLTRHLSEACLLVFWPEAWDHFKRQWRAFDPGTQSIVKRVVGGTARRAKLDRLGRVQVPKVLRDYAQLDGKCFVMGQSDKIELWAMATWDAAHGAGVHQGVDVSALM